MAEVEVLEEQAVQDEDQSWEERDTYRPKCFPRVPRPPRVRCLLTPCCVLDPLPPPAASRADTRPSAAPKAPREEAPRARRLHDASVLLQA